MSSSCSSVSSHDPKSISLTIAKDLEKDRIRQAKAKAHSLPQGLRESVLKALHYPRSYREIACIVKIYAYDFFNMKDEAQKARGELGGISRLASFYEGCSRNSVVDSPHSFDEIMISRRVSQTHFGQCTLTIFNGMDRVDIKPKYNHIYKTSTDVQIEEVGIQMMSPDTECVFYGNACVSSHSSYNGEPCVEGFWLDIGKVKTVHHWQYPSGYRYPGVDVNNSFNVDHHYLSTEVNPVRGLSAEEYASLCQSTHIFGNGKVLIIDFASLPTNKWDRVVPKFMERYLKSTKTTALCLYWEDGKYHNVLLQQKFVVDCAITFASSSFNEAWRNWKIRIADEEIPGLTETQYRDLAKRNRPLWNIYFSGYQVRYAVQNMPSFVTNSDYNLRCGRHEITFTHQPSNTVVMTFPRTNILLSQIFREIISGQKPIEEPMLEDCGGNRVYLVDQGKYLGLGRGRQVSTAHVSFITQEQIEVVGDTIRSRDDSTLNIAEVFLPSSANLAYRSIYLEGNQPHLVTKNGKKVPIYRVTDTPLYPNISLHHRGIVIQTLNIQGFTKGLLVLISEYADHVSSMDYLRTRVEELRAVKEPTGGDQSQAHKRWGNSFVINPHFLPKGKK